MSAINWTRTYEVVADVRTFRVFLSEQTGGAFHASCLWYEKGRLLKAPGQSGVAQFHLEQRHAPSEDEALAQITAWLRATFPGVSDLRQVS